MAIYVINYFEIFLYKIKLNLTPLVLLLHVAFNGSVIPRTSTV